MNDKDVPTDKLLPREELINLFCPTDDPDKWAKAVQLTLLFESIDKLGDNVIQLQETWSQIKLVQEEKSRLIVDLMHDRDAWKLIALSHERKLDELGKL